MYTEQIRICKTYKYGIHLHITGILSVAFRVTSVVANNLSKETTCKAYDLPIKKQTYIVRFVCMV